MVTNMIEIKNIIGFEFYFISEDGIITNKRGLTRKTQFENGYEYIILKNNDTIKKFLVHRLVAIAFISNPENKPQVNHKNGIRNDNRVENLEWVTSSENHIHAFRCLNKRPWKSRYILDTKTGITYKNIKSAADTFNMNYSTLNSMLSGVNPNKTSMIKI